MHRNGEVAAVAVSRIDVEADDYTSQLWLLRCDGPGAARQLTYGWRDTSPLYSPDGAWLAFVRAERDAAGKVGKNQLWVMPTDGGEPRKLTDTAGSVMAPAWSPDSTRIAYLTRTPPVGREAGVEPGKQPPRRITRLSYRRDGIGFLDSPKHIWITALDGSAPRQVTDDDVDHQSVRWHPAGDWLTFAAAGHEAHGNDLRSDIWVGRPDGSEIRALTYGGYAFFGAQFSPDGTAVIGSAGIIGPDGRDMVGRNEVLWWVPLDASSPPSPLLDQETYHLAAAFEVTAAGVLFPNMSRGAIELLRDPFDGGTPTVLMSGPRQIIGVGTAADAIVATVLDGRSWGEVVRRSDDGTEHPMSDFNAGFGHEASVYDLDEVTAAGPDGYPVHGWLVRPSGDGPHPLLLLIHGGPFAQYGWALFDEAQVYAGAGYAVLMANPRGSAGYGEAHGQAIKGNVGEVSTGDLMAILDHVLAADASLDRDRVAVLGGSHGGFMTTWLAAHEGHRFRTAITERAVNAIDSFTGSSDIGWIFADSLYGTDPENVRRQSPLTYAGDITIPTLIIHSEQDWRCPIEQAQRLFVTLRRNGVETEMLIFPGEGHELTRSGLPSHRLARFEAILKWLANHL
jgi:dipeptidyl aminopeptidase/acylaminoacyl peptidase